MSATLEADAMTPQEITKLEKSLEEDVTTLSHKRERKAALEQQVRSTSTHMSCICFSARPLRDALLASALSPQSTRTLLSLSHAFISFPRILSVIRIPGQVTDKRDEFV